MISRYFITGVCACVFAELAGTCRQGKGSEQWRERRWRRVRELGSSSETQKVGLALKTFHEMKCTTPCPSGTCVLNLPAVNLEP